jgi:inosine/xanthosine triphosphatase
VTDADRDFEHVCLGGTFSPLHRGHHALLLRAFDIGDNVFAGVTSGELAQKSRQRTVPDVDERVHEVQAFLEESGVAERVEVAPISNPFGRALEERFEAIVVSPETRSTAERINEKRDELGLAPLAIEQVPFVLAFDGLPVNGTRVANGEIDPLGVEPKSVHLAVGSQNPVKVEAAERAFGRWVPNVAASALDVDSGVPEQPRDEEGPKGAARRAVRALEASDKRGLGVGIEASIDMDDPSGERLDVQYCAIADEQGRITTGHGPGFAYPQVVMDALDEGHTVGEAVSALEQRDDVGEREGAIGALTRGGATRTELTEWAVIAAIVPRVRPELYDPLPGQALTVEGLGL